MTPDLIFAADTPRNLTAAEFQTLAEVLPDLDRFATVLAAEPLADKKIANRCRSGADHRCYGSRTPRGDII